MAFVAMKCVHNARLDAELVVVRAAVQEVFFTVHYGEVVVSGVSVELVTIAVYDDETVGSITPREGVVVTVRNGERVDARASVQAVFVALHGKVVLVVTAEELVGVAGLDAERVFARAAVE